LTSKEIVELIEAELEKQHKTKGEFFETCGVTRAQMSNWRREKNYPQTPVLITISDYLGIDLLGKKEAPHADDGEGRYESMTVGNDEDDSELEELLQIIRSISPDDRPRAKAILTALAQTSAVPSGPSSKAQESP